GALYLYFAHLKSGKVFSGYYWASLLLFVVAALSKAQAILLPAVLILVDIVLKRDLSLKRLALKVPFFLPTLAVGLLAVVAQWRAGAVAAFPSLSFVDRFLMSCYALVNYLWKLVLPIGLSCVYPYPLTDGQINTKW